MEITINRKVKVNITTILVKAGVRYWEDSEINGEPDTENGENIPCKKGDLWMPEIEIETGKILNWEQGKKADIHYKVCDCLGYEIKDENGDIVLSAEDGYVPNTLSPKEAGFGDYIIMDIDENGLIDNWFFNVSDFENTED